MSTNNMSLMPHQQEALDQTESFPNIGVYYDMGLGKTFIGSEAMMRYNSPRNLLVCQKSKVSDWVTHFRTYYTCGAMDLTKMKGVEKWCLLGCQPIGVINYDLIWRRRELSGLHNFTLMLDESSLIQNPTSNRTKFILKMHPDHVVLLSGTPVGGKYENLWSQLRLLGYPIAKTTYENMYVNWAKLDIGNQIIRVVDKKNPYKNVDRLKEKMREYGCIFKKTEEVIDLPAQSFQKVLVNPVREYKTFQKHGIVTMRDVELVGDNSLTKLLYSRQLCGAYNWFKLEAVSDLISSTNERLIIFYNFNNELDALKGICEAQRRPVSEVNGHTKDLSAYEESSDSVTLVQYQAGAKGLNLQKSCRVIYFTLPLSSEDFEQSKKRIHRIGQDRPCFYYILLSRGTVEESILRTLEQRRDYTDELFKEEQNDTM